MRPVGRKDEFGILGCSLVLIGRDLEAEKCQSFARRYMASLLIVGWS